MAKLIELSNKEVLEVSGGKAYDIPSINTPISYPVSNENEKGLTYKKNLKLGAYIGGPTTLFLAGGTYIYKKLYNPNRIQPIINPIVIKPEIPAPSLISNPPLSIKRYTVLGKGKDKTSRREVMQFQKEVIQLVKIERYIEFKKDVVELLELYKHAITQVKKSKDLISTDERRQSKKYIADLREYYNSRVLEAPAALNTATQNQENNSLSQNIQNTYNQDNLYQRVNINEIPQALRSERYLRSLHYRPSTIRILQDNPSESEPIISQPTITKPIVKLAKEKAILPQSEALKIHELASTFPSFTSAALSSTSTSQQITPNKTYKVGISGIKSLGKGDFPTATLELIKGEPLSLSQIKRNKLNHRIATIETYLTHTRVSISNSQTPLFIAFKAKLDATLSSIKNFFAGSYTLNMLGEIEKPTKAQCKQIDLLSQFINNFLKLAEEYPAQYQALMDNYGKIFLSQMWQSLNKLESTNMGNIYYELYFKPVTTELAKLPGIKCTTLL